MASSIISTITKLKGRENYEDWAFAVENFLILEGMQECISKDGSANDAKAKAKIILTIDPSLYVHIKNEKSTKELWLKLKRMFDDTGFTRRIGLLRNLISIRRENCDSMAQYVTLMVETSQRLNNTGFKINDEWVGSLLLAGLPEKFAPMIMAIEHSGIEITADAIKTKLIDMEDGGSDTNNPQSAFTSKSWQQRKSKAANMQITPDVSKSNVKKSAIICYKCKQPGHYKNQCEKNKQTSHAFSAVFLSGTFNRLDWYIDSGASKHMTPNEDWLINKTNHDIKEIVIADQSRIRVTCCGDTQITTTLKNTSFDIPVTEVLCVPSLATNLLSVSQLMKQGNKVSFADDNCYIYNKKDQLVATASLTEGVYKLNTKKDRCLLSSVSGTVWHRRLGHLNSSDLEKMKDGAVIGMSYTDKSQITKSNCKVCCEGKQTRLPFPHAGNRSTGLLDTVHADICGPMETRSIGGSKYFLLFVDDYSKMTFVYFLKTKDETFNCFKTYKSLVENQTGKRIKIFRTDNGLEFCSKEYERYLQNAGIIHQKTNPYTPEQNGLCERLNRTIVEKAKCMLYDANLSKKFWAEAVNTAVYLRNRSVVSGLNNKTPFELWTGKKPDISHLRIFGSKIMVHIPKEKRLKFDKKSKECILVGYPDHVKGYRYYNPQNNQISTSRDIVVIEEVNRNDLVEIKIDESIPDSMEEKIKPEINTETVGDADLIKKEEIIPETTTKAEEDIVEDLAGDKVLKPKRVRKKPDRFVVGVAKSDVSVSESELTVDDALNGPESLQWKQAMAEELKSFEENDAWEVVQSPSPEQGTVVSCKWVFQKKLNSDNTVRYRARLVAKGFTQRPGIDFDETFSPVLRHSTLRLMFALAVKLNLEMCHLDVNTAFLNGVLSEVIYMQKPVGLECNNDNAVLKLKRAIYGLKQSSRIWYQRVEDLLTSIGYKKSQSEPCLFTKNDGNSRTIVLLYVDDFFLFSNCIQETNRLKCKLSENFKIKDLGCIKRCLGMNVNFDKENGVISINQKDYIDELIKKFNINDCKAVNTPIEQKLNLVKSSVCDKKLLYQQLIGSMMYLAVLTRPDIVFSVNYLSQFNNCYTDEHWTYAKRVLKYLKTTKDFCLVFNKNGNNQLEAYVDADWASNQIDRKSYTGYFFQLAGCAVAWETRKQCTVALSSTEAEYMGLADCCKEAIYLKNLLYEITNENHPITIYNDNQSAIKLSVNPVFHKRSKHIDVRYHFCRECISNNLVQVKYAPTAEMPADLLTKGLCQNKHYKFLKMLGIVKL